MFMSKTAGERFFLLDKATGLSRTQSTKSQELLSLKGVDCWYKTPSPAATGSIN